MQRDESAAQVQIHAETIERYEVIGLWDAAAPDRLARLHRISVLESLGFSLEQIARALQSGVSIDQLRGMWRLRQCQGFSAEVLAEIAARIDRLEEPEIAP